jgi:hypothetical protein
MPARRSRPFPRDFQLHGAQPGEHRHGPVVVTRVAAIARRRRPPPSWLRGTSICQEDLVKVAEALSHLRPRLAGPPSRGCDQPDHVRRQATDDNGAQHAGRR